MAIKKYPEIAYKEHPAFTGLFESYKYDNVKINDMINNIDIATKETSNITDINQLHIIFEKNIMKSIDCLADYVKENIDSIVAFELFTNAIDYVKEEILKNLIRNSLKLNYTKKNCDMLQLNSLKNDGMYIVNVDKKMKRKLYDASKPYYNRLKERAKRYPHLRSYENIKRFSKLARCIKKFVKEAGVLDTVSNYMQTDMVIMGTGIEYSCADQTWFKNPYPDLTGYHSDHNYLHIDEDAHAPKMLYYLTPVENVEQGATKFIIGSHIAPRSNFVILFQKGLDRISADRFFKFDDSYYRPLYKNIELRNLLAKLPTRLIGSSHLGDDVMKDSDISKELLNNEVTFLSEGLEAIVFDGGNGLHKGANVTVGERLSLQIVYKAKNEYLINRLLKQYKLSDKLVLILKQLRELFL